MLFTVQLLNSADLLYGVTASLRAVLLLPVLTLVATAAAAIRTVRSRRGSGASVLARFHQPALLAGLGLLTWFVQQWNLMGWRF